MKKMSFSGCIILFLASMVFVSCAEMQKIALSEGNLADLKGKWVGSRKPNNTESFNTELEIFNDSLPIQGKVIFCGGIDLWSGPYMMRVTDFKQGKINDQGNLLITDSKIEMELSFYKDDGKLKLEGPYSSPLIRGTMSFKKKK